MYLYQCYVTDTWKLCDDLVPVELDMEKAWNPDNETITFTTDNVAGSGEMVIVEFLGKDGYNAGAVTIYFTTEIVYMIGGCSKYFTPFSETLPIETEKTWTITYNYMDKRVVLHCNEVQVLNVLLSDIVCAYISLDQSKWRNYWENKPTQIKFLSYDTASDTYCMSSNPGKYNGVIDSGE